MSSEVDGSQQTALGEAKKINSILCFINYLLLSPSSSYFHRPKCGNLPLKYAKVFTEMFIGQ